MSPASKAQQKATAKYVKKNYDEIKIRVDKGRKPIIQAASEAVGESLNGYIYKAIDERLERQNAPSGSTEDSGEAGE